MLQHLSNKNYIKLDLQFSKEDVLNEYENISKRYSYNNKPFDTIKLPDVPQTEYPEILRIRESLKSTLPFTNYFFSFIKLCPNKCYQFHTDDKYFLHIPIIANDDCFMIIDDTLVQLDLFNCYILNTTKKHSAYNLGKEDRVHLIMGIKL